MNEILYGAKLISFKEHRDFYANTLSNIQNQGNIDTEEIIVYILHQK